MPDPARLSDESREIKSRHCRFCLHRLQRAQSGEHTHSQAGEYCPLDLYSGDVDRTQRAVLHLVQAWKTSGGKGNNLKLFRNGRMLGPLELVKVQELGDDSEKSEEVLVQRLGDLLASSPLVRRLKELQAQLDSLDIEGLGKLLREREGISLLDLSADDVFKLGGEIHISEYEAFLENFSANHGGSTGNGRELSTRDAIVSHLLSASFKDCSMIIQLPEGGDPKAQLVDCDLKSISRLQRYAKLDRDLVETCRRHQERGEKLRKCYA